MNDPTDPLAAALTLALTAAAGAGGMYNGLSRRVTRLEVAVGQLKTDHQDSARQVAEIHAAVVKKEGSQ